MDTALKQRVEILSDVFEEIKAIRELVLDLAVQGKLVPQDPAETSAEALLNSIRQVLSESKRYKQPAPWVADFPDHDLPPGWQHATGYELGEVSPKNTAAEQDVVGFVPMPLVPTRFGFDVEHEEVAWKDISKGFTHLADGDVCIGKITPCFQNRKSAVVQGLPNGIGAGTTELFVLRPTPDGMNPHYLLIWFKSPQFISEGMSRMTGTAGQQRVPRDYVFGRAIPVPPRQEQDRIVEKVREIMGLCDILSEALASRDQAATRLRRAILDKMCTSETMKDFDAAWSQLAAEETLLSSRTGVDDLRKALLALAVRGKLERQDIKEEAAEETLVRLRAEREAWLRATQLDEPEHATVLRKLGKLKPSVPPFPLPAGWTSARLLDVSALIVDCHNKTAPYVPEGIPILRTTNIRGGAIRWKEMKYVSETTYKFWSRRCPPRVGDIVFTREAPMGEAAIIPADQIFCLGQRTMLIRPMEDFVLGKYILLSLLEPGLMQRSAGSALGSTVKHFRVGDVESFSIAIPPLQEQQRIVARVESLIAFCDALEQSLGERDHLIQKLSALPT